MKKIICFLSCIFFVFWVNAQVSKTVNVDTAGTLSSLLTATEKSTVTNLTLTGNIDARDFKTMRDEMLVLSSVDIENTNIQGYTGSGGTSSSSKITYLENEVPQNAFNASLGKSNQIKSIILPNRLASIGNNAFVSCKELENFTIPGFVKTIGTNAFSNCSKLVGMNIPKSVVSIGSAAFQYCLGLKEITVPSSVATIGSNIFLSCENLENIYVDPSNSYFTSIDGVVFNKTQTKLLIFPPGREGSYSIPSSVLSIESLAFCNCHKLRSVFIPNTVTSLGDHAFSASRLTTVTIPKSINSIGNGAFLFCNLLNEINVDPENPSFCSTDGVVFDKAKTKLLICPTAKSGSYAVPEGLISISDDSFNGSILTDITLNDKLASIGNNAFANCVNLRTIKIPEKLSSIGTSAFANCLKLTSISVNVAIPLNLKDQSTFNQINKTNCILYVPFRSKSLYQSALYWKDFSNIIELPGISVSSDTIKFNSSNSKISIDIEANIAWKAKAKVNWLAINPISGDGSGKLTIEALNNNNDLHRVGQISITGDSLVSKIVIVKQSVSSVLNINVKDAGTLSTLLSTDQKSNVVSLILTGNIDSRDFKTIRDEMPKLVELDLSNVTIKAYRNDIEDAIPDEAFYFNSTYTGKTSLTKVVLPPTLKRIGRASFSNTGLVKIDIPNSVKIIDSDAFEDCISLQDFILPEGVLKIGNETFSGCVRLKTVSIPQSVNEIGNGAFAFCFCLTTITIPSTVIAIGSEAFRLCKNLQTIFANPVVPTNLSNSEYVFSGVNNGLCKLVVPADSKALYQDADKWKDFSNIIASDFYLSEYEKNISPNGESISFKINTDKKWSVTSSQSWATISPKNGNGNSTVSVTADKNTDVFARSGEIKVSATGCNMQVLSITQASSLEVEELKINVETPGSLSNILSSVNTNKLKKLIITGTIDVRDFSAIRQLVPVLTSLDLTESTVVEYFGIEGTQWNNYKYLANELPEDIFTGIENLREIKLPKNIANIGSGVFSGCENLVSIIIPDDVDSIGSYAFYYCSSLQAINIPNNIKSIGSHAFDNCESITSIQLPNSVTSIGDYAFSHCLKLKSINLPQSLEKINDGLFYYCYSLESINIPGSIQSIGNEAFGQTCRNLVDIYTKSTYLSTLGELVFSGVDKTKCKLHVPQGEVELFKQTNQWKDFVNIIALEGFLALKDEIHFYADEDKSIIELFVDKDWVASSDADWLSVTSSGSSKDNMLIGVSKNENEASRFAFVSITSGESQMKIKVTQMGRMDELTIHVETPGTLSTLLSSDQKNNVCRLTITGNIDARDFHVLRDEIPKLSDLDLSDVNIKEYIGNWGTNYGANSTYIQNEIPTYSFRNKKLLSSIILPNTITSIGIGAFFNCNYLNSLNIPKSVTSIGESAFSDCTSLVIVNLPESIIQIGKSSFIRCSSLEILKVPNSLISIEESTFYGCLSLKIVIGKKSLLTHIGARAFLGCQSIETINIPESVNEIGDEVFWGCVKLNSIYAYSNMPVDISFSKDVFASIDPSSDLNVNQSVCKLYVPCGAKKLYQLANQWKDFVNIIEMPGLKVSSDSLEIASVAGSRATVELTIDGTWTATSAQNWLTVAPASGNGTQTLLFTAEANPSFMPRKAIVTINSPDFGTKTVTIIQEPGVPSTLAINNVSGSLYQRARNSDLSKITNLTIAGTMDARDFKAIRDFMPNLVSLDISGVTIVGYVGTEGTSGSSNLTYSANTIPDNAFLNSKNLVSIILPKTVHSLGKSSFEGCMGLISITLPSSINSIGENAFKYCSLASIYFHSSEIQIGDNAFSECLDLIKIYFFGNSPLILDGNTDPFNGLGTGISLYVPKGMLDLFQSSEFWKKFGNYQEINGFTLASKTVRIGAKEGSSASMPISSYVSWSAVSNVNWLSVSPATEVGNETLLFTAQANPTSSTRTSIVTISANGFDSQTITITQEGKVDSSPQYFLPVWTGNGVDHMNINVYSASLNGANLEVGDEIGIFDDGVCVGSGKVTIPISQANTLDMIVSRNDELMDGYTEGDPISFRIYQKSTGTLYSSVSAKYLSLDQSWSSSGTFEIGTTAFVDLKVGSTNKQEIKLISGWNIISANVVQTNLEMKSIFQGLIDAGKLKKVMDESGKTLENFGAFGGWKNSIGNWQPTEGYKVNVPAATVLTLVGQPIPLPFEIPLSTGWNIISYPATSSQDVKAVFQSLIDTGKLKKVMDESGKTLENFGAFGGWKNSIGSLITGKGYKVNVSGSCTLTITEGGTKAATIVPEVLASTHFTPIYSGNGTDHMSINLVDLSVSGIELGDELGVFDGSLCVGSAKVGVDQLTGDYLSMPVSASDGLTSVPNGFTEGHLLTVRYSREGKEYTPSLELLNRSKQLFAKGESIFLRMKSGQTTGIDPLAQSDGLRVKCYPNPFSEQVTIEIELPKPGDLKVEVFDTSGRLIRTLYKGNANKNEHLLWDGRGQSGVRMPSGTYLLKVNDLFVKVILSK
jgi:hypothetical protein